MDAWRAQMQAKAFKGLDSDGSGGVSLAEFQSGLQKLPAGRSGPAAPAGTAAQATLESAFKAVDTNGDGQVSGAELSAMMQAKGHRGHHQHRPAESQGDGSQRGLGSTLAAQLLGQGQAVPGTDGAADAAAGMSGAAEQARHMLMRYAAAQGGAALGGAARGGTSLAA